MGVIPLSHFLRRFEKPDVPHYPGDKVTPHGGGWLHTPTPPTQEDANAAMNAALEAASAIPDRPMFRPRRRLFRGKADPASFPCGDSPGHANGFPMPPPGNEMAP